VRLPGIRNLLLWLIPFAAFSFLLDWMVIAQNLHHYRQYGHLLSVDVGLVFAISFTGTTIAIPFLWMQARKEAKRRR